MKYYGQDPENKVVEKVYSSLSLLMHVIILSLHTISSCPQKEMWTVNILFPLTLFFSEFILQISPFSLDTLEKP